MKPGCLSQLSTARSLDLSPEQAKPAFSFVSQPRYCSSSLLLEVVLKQRSDNGSVRAVIKSCWNIRGLCHSQVTLTHLGAQPMQKTARKHLVRGRRAPESLPVGGEAQAGPSQVGTALQARRLSGW